MVCCK
jgi:hypothetical protein